MRMQIARTISVVTLLVMLSATPFNAWAASGTCNIPSCRPKQLSVQSGTQALSLYESFQVLQAMTFLLWL